MSLRWSDPEVEALSADERDELRDYANEAGNPLNRFGIEVAISFFGGAVASLYVLIFSGQDLEDVYLGMAFTIGLAIVLSFPHQRRLFGSLSLTLLFNVVLAAVFVSVAAYPFVIRNVASPRELFPEVVVFGVALVVAGLAVVVSGRIADRRRQQPPTLQQLKSRVSIDGAEPTWARDLHLEMHSLRHEVERLSEQRPVPRRAATLGEWWKLRPSGKGPF